MRLRLMDGDGLITKISGRSEEKKHMDLAIKSHTKIFGEADLMVGILVDVAQILEI